MRSILDYSEFTRFILHEKFPTICLTESCFGYYRLNTINFLGRRIDFIPGKKFNSFGTGNGWCTNEITFEDNKLIHVQKGYRTLVAVAEFTEDELTLTLANEDVVARQHFVRHDSLFYC